MKISDRVKHLRAELGLTQTELAKRVGISQQSLQKIEDGQTQSPRKLVQLASALGCSAEWLQFGESEIREPALFYESSKTSSQEISVLLKKFPIISYLQAAQWTEDNDYLIHSTTTEWEESSSPAGQHSFWLRVIGDSMTCASGISIPEGYLILVDPSLAAKNGDLVVAKLDIGDEVTFKKMIVDAGQTYLRPLNPDYRPIEINDNCLIIGTVTQAKIKF